MINTVKRNLCKVMQSDLTYGVLLFHLGVCAMSILLETKSLTVRYSFSNCDDCVFVGDKVVIQVGMSFVDCVKECVLRQSCSGLIYDRRTLLCEVFSSEDSYNYRRQNCVRVIREEIEILSIPAICTICKGQEKCVIKDTGVASCEITDCSTPTPVINGEILGNMLDIGSKIEYKCDDGYVKRDGEYHAMCLDPGHWSGHVTCVEERNLAVGMPAVQSSTLKAGKEASNAVDGIWGAPTAKTGKSESSAWWEVNLEQEYFIKRIIVQTRPGGTDSKFRDIIVSIYDQSHTEETVCGMLVPEAPVHENVTFVCDNIIEGQIVRITKTKYLDDNDLLMIAEVGVFLW